MKNFVRWLVRNNMYAAKIMRKLSLLPLPTKSRREFMMAYLQSDAKRPELSETLGRYISQINDLKPQQHISLSKSAVIKHPSKNEKGFILVGFEHELDRLISCNSFLEIKQDYDVLFMPTWQPFYSEALLRMLKHGKQNQIFPFISDISCCFRRGVFQDSWHLFFTPPASRLY